MKEFVHNNVRLRKELFHRHEHIGDMQTEKKLIIRLSFSRKRFNPLAYVTPLGRLTERTSNF